MLLFKRRAFFALPLVLAACGFEPVYKEGTAARNMLGQIAVEVQSGRYNFEFRDRLIERLGDAGSSAPYLLTYKRSASASDLVISETDDITRFVLDGTADYQIIERSSQKILSEGQVSANTAYSAIAGTYPTQVAKEDANIRLAQALAEQIVSRLAITAKDWLK